MQEIIAQLAHTIHLVSPSVSVIVTIAVSLAATNGLLDLILSLNLSIADSNLESLIGDTLKHGSGLP